MKLGLAFSRSTLSVDNLRFARQAGVTHIVVHYTDYEKDKAKLPAHFQGAYGFTGDEALWTYEELRDLRQMINDEGMELEALENFNPGFWSDVLLDGPRKEAQIENLKQLIRNVGRAGIPTMGYSFNLMSVCGHSQLPLARGGAVTGAFLEPDRRNPDLIAACDAGIGLGALAVDAHLAAADDLVDQAARRALELPEQEIVEPLVVPVLGHAHQLDPACDFVCRH